MSFREKYIGNKAFYRRALAVSVPMMIQNGVTNLVTLLDNVMVGSVGTEAMSGVSIVNQFIFIFNLLIFGAVSAAGLFTAQYHGMGDVDGVRYTFRFKFIINLVAGGLGTLVFALFGNELISSFLHESASEGNLELTLELGLEYLGVMLIGLIPYAISQVYASTMRETGDTTTPMIASTSAVFINVALNSLLIFGLFGLPALGVVGAAIATVISRFAELLILVATVHTKTVRYKFAKGAYSSFKIPAPLVKDIVLKGLPIMLNELLWASAMTARNGCYATRGLDVVAALNISTTLVNLTSVVYMALGSSIAIIVGNMLGAGEIEEAKDAARKLLAFSVAASTVLSAVMALVSPLFPLIYNTSSQVRSIATYAIIVAAIITPFNACAHATYFTIRSGGKVLITLLLDSIFVWVVTFPIAFALSEFTDMGIHSLYLLAQSAEVIKVIFGFIILKKVNWARKIVSSSDI